MPDEAKVKNFDYDAEVELVNPIADAITTATYMVAEVDWCIKTRRKLLINQQLEQKHNQGKNN